MADTAEKAKKGLWLAVILIISILNASDAFAAKKALLIGIADYKHLPSYSKRGITKLKGPVNDVAILKNALITYYGFANKDIKTLTDSEATRENIIQSFDKWLVDGTKEGDTVFFYYSGHGSQVPDQNGDEADGKDEVFLPYDTKPIGGANIILDDEMGMMLNRLSKREVVVFIDSCYSGGATRGIKGEVVSRLEPVMSWHEKFVPITGYEPRFFPKASDMPAEQIFLSASRENQIALEMQLPGGFHGAFTYSLVNVLKKKSGLTYKDLYEHVAKELRDTFRLPQEPQIEPKGSKKIEGNVFAAQAQGPAKPQTAGPAPSQPAVSQPPAKEKGDKVLVMIEPLAGASPENMKKLNRELNNLSYVRTTADGVFDRLIRGEFKNGRYHARLLNRIGDAIKIAPAKDINALVKSIESHLKYEYMVKQLSRITHPDPSFKVKIWVTDEERRDFKVGERIVFNFSSEKGCNLLLLNLDSHGSFHIIFPNQFYANNRVEAGRTLTIPDKEMAGRFGFEFGEPAGEEVVKAICTTGPLSLASLGLEEFEKYFNQSGIISVPEKNRAIFVKKVVESISSNSLGWSEDAIVIRSHQAKKQ